MIKYTIDGYGDEEIDILSKEIDKISNEEIRGKAMTFAQMLRKEGLEIGIEQGIELGKRQQDMAVRREFAKTLLSLGVSSVEAQKLSKLPADEFCKLIAEKV